MSPPHKAAFEPKNRYAEAYLFLVVKVRHDVTEPAQKNRPVGPLVGAV